MIFRCVAFGVSRCFEDFLSKGLFDIDDGVRIKEE